MPQHTGASLLAAKCTQVVQAHEVGMHAPDAMGTARVRVRSPGMLDRAKPGQAAVLALHYPRRMRLTCTAASHAPCMHADHALPEEGGRAGLTQPDARSDRHLQ